MKYSNSEIKGVLSKHTHTHIHIPEYAYDTEIIRKMRLYVCACTFITYKHMHTHASTHAGTDICMVMHVSIHLYVTHKPSRVCLRVLVHL